MRGVCLLCGLTLAAEAALAGCRKSPADQAKDAATTLASWEATLHLLEQQQARGAVPEAYARQVRRAAEEARTQAQAKLRESSSP
jgi:hypothetical protein